VAAVTALCGDGQRVCRVPCRQLPMAVPYGVCSASDQHLADSATNSRPICCRLSPVACSPTVHDEENLSTDRLRHYLLFRFLSSSILRVLLQVSTCTSSRLSSLYVPLFSSIIWDPVAIHKIVHKQNMNLLKNYFCDAASAEICQVTCRARTAGDGFQQAKFLTIHSAV